MATGEQTILDAPVTPAPLFAYRALRAVIWGEEDTPEPASKHAEATAKKIFELSPGAQDRRGKSQLQLTPSQKRKHGAIAQPSPSKSILRTPGVNTPRRALLKDLNVTFKDLRKSVSPEMLRKDQLAQVVVQVDMNEEKENRPAGHSMVVAPSKNEVDPMEDFFSITRLKSVNAQSQPRARPIETSSGPIPRASTETVPASTTTSTGTSSFDAETYVRNTEKEMKRLIKYGQKMRDHARRMDEENTKLRLMLDEMREENERLQLQFEGREQTRKQVPPSKKDHDGNAVQAKTSMSNLQQRQQSQPRHQHLNLTNTKYKPTKSAAPDEGLESSVNHKNQKLAPTRDPQPNLTRKPDAESRGSTTSRTKRPLPISTSNLNPDLIPLAKSASPSPTPSPSPVKKQRPSHVTSAPTNQDHISTHHSSTKRPSNDNDGPVTTIAPTTGTGTVTGGLAPDRLAAARARVRKRAELRKASSDGVGSENLDVGIGSGYVDGKSRDEIGSKVETSLVDWAGL